MTETLEDRRLLAGVTVGNALDVINPTADTSSISALIANDGGDGISLREAIVASNNTAGADTITFDPTIFTGGAANVIRLQSGQLSISEAVHIDGGLQQVVISGDANGDDTLVAGTYITDAGVNTNTADNTRVLRFTANTGDLTLSGLTLTGGVTFDGGGIVFDSGGLLTLNSSSVSGNNGGVGDGGGIWASSGSVTLTGSTVSGNISGNNGGGIFAPSGPVTLTSSTVSGNSSSDDGGGIYTNSGAVTLSSSTVSGNSSGFRGGGIFAYNTGTNPPVTIENSIVAGNMAVGSGPDLRLDPDGTLDVNFSLIGDNAGTTLVEAQTADTNGNLIGSSAGGGGINAMLFPLANNGGPTQTSTTSNRIPLSVITCTRIAMM